jgi:hypothetical protein
MNPQRDMDFDRIGGEPSEKKKIIKPHYKEMYESAMRELELQRKLNKMDSPLNWLGWILFVVTVIYLLIKMP